MADMAMQQVQQMHTMHLQMQQMQRQQKVGPPLEQMPTGSVPAGSLIIADVFTPSQPEDKFSHGEMVNMSAVRDGFKGQVFTQAQPGSTVRDSRQLQAEGRLFDPKATPQQTRENVAEYARNNALSILESQTQLINGASDSGAKNSALNISAGGSVGFQTLSLYADAAMAWNPKLPKGSQEAGLTAATNFAEAYGLDVNKMTSSDPKISGPERARLQEALAKGVDGSLQSSPEVAKAKREFTTAVGRFESGRNSVVISAGNEGNFAQQLAEDSHGYAAKTLPKSFTTNFLDTPAATMVGATRWNNGNSGAQEQVADYSNVNSGVDIYASGSLSLNNNQKADTHGTSFAAPRVAATMAALHKQNPQMSSAQIEALMKQSLTHSLNGSAGGSVSVLDYQKSSDFMVGRNPQ